MDDLRAEHLRCEVEAGEVALERRARGERVRDREVREVVLRPQPREERLDLEIGVDPEHGHVDAGELALLVLRALVRGDRFLDLLRELPERDRRAVHIEHLPHLPEIVLRALEDHVQNDLERGFLELPLPRADPLRARPKVEERVGMHLVDAHAALLEELRAFGGRCSARVEVALQALDVLRSPRAVLAVRPVQSTLDVVVVVRLVPVADVDHVEDVRAVLVAHPASDRGVEEQPERSGGELVAVDAPPARRPELLVEVLLAEQHRPNRGVGQ